MSHDHVSDEKYVRPPGEDSPDPVRRPAGCLIPGHISSAIAPGDAAGWLVDELGHAHPIGPGRTVIGRRADAQLVILSASVSRDHAELRRVDGGWELRDLGSRNGTQVDGKRLVGRTALAGDAAVRFGDVGFVFVDHPAAMPGGQPSMATVEARSQACRFVVRGPGVEVCLVTGEDSAVALHRRGDADWTELDLAPLELQLLRILCTRAVEDADSPSATRGCVPSKQLVAGLAFATDYPTEENVRKLVQRTRATLRQIGAGDLVETVPSRGYYVAWSVARS